MTNTSISQDEIALPEIRKPTIERWTDTQINKFICPCMFFPTSALPILGIAREKIKHLLKILEIKKNVIKLQVLSDKY